MTMNRVLTAFFSLAVVTWCASGLGQRGGDASPSQGQPLPVPQELDPFGPVAPQGTPEGETSVLQQSQETPEMSLDTISAKTPAFLAEQSSERSAEILRKLGEPLAKPGLSFVETPLSEVVDFLRKEYDMEIQIDTLALDDQGLSPDDTVTCNLRNISLASALKLMLKQHHLTYIVADEVLLITSEVEADARLTVRIYPVGDLLQPKEGEPHGSAPRIEELMEVIVSTVAADTWTERGGAATIRSLQPGLIIVAQIESVHREIGHVLAALRRAREHEFARSTPVDTRPAGGFGSFGSVEEYGGRGYGGRGGFSGGRGEPARQGSGSRDELRSQ